MNAAADSAFAAAAARAHAEALLDEALRETFPASDPVSVFVPPPLPVRPA